MAAGNFACGPRGGSLREAAPCRKVLASDGIISMMDFVAARRMMVDGQVRTSDVTDLRIIAAMLELPRERFVPAANADLAYLDLDVPVSEATSAEPARRLLKPMVLAKMVQAAAVKAEDRVLDVACATGYSSA